MIKLLVLCCMLTWFYGCEGETKKSDVDEKRLAAITPPDEMPTMPKPSGGLVLSIDSSAITADEIIEPVQEHLKKLAQQMDYPKFNAAAKPLLGSVLVQKIADIRLYEKAKEALPENVDQAVIDKIVEEEVQKFIAKCGGDYATVEKMLKSMGTNWRDFYQQQRRAILVQSFVSQEIKIEKPVTHSELVEYYNKIKDEFYAKKAQIAFRLIDLEIGNFIDANTTNEMAEQKTKELAWEISGKIKNGEDFAELVKKYSNGSERQDGGLWPPITPGSLAPPYNAIEKAVENMSAGQISEPVVTKGHIFIIKLESRQAATCEPFEKVQEEVEARMMYEKHKKIVDDMMNKIIEQVDLSYAEGFIEYCAENAWQNLQAKK